MDADTDADKLGTSVTVGIYQCDITPHHMVMIMGLPVVLSDLCERA
jgi:hypothetical protein